MRCRLGVAIATLLVFSASFVFSSVLKAQCTGEALRPKPRLNDVYRRYHPSACWVETDYMEDYVVTVDGIANQSNNFFSRRRNVYCPIINDDLMSNELWNQYTQILLSGYDSRANINDKDNILIATHCIADPYGLTTECDKQTWSGGKGAPNGCYGSNGYYWDMDPECAINYPSGSYTLNLDVQRTSGRGDWESFIALSLAKGTDTSITGYEVSFCSPGATCDAWPDC